MTLSWLFWQILISYCKFLMSRSLKWSILGAHTIILAKNIHKVTKTVYVWFEFLWIRCYHTFLYRNIKAALDKREKRTTMTLFMICFCYFLFVMPIALVNIIDDTHFSPRIHLALFCVYWLQYSLNFFIYAARSEQYRKAYWYFLRKVSIN